MFLSHYLSYKDHLGLKPFLSGVVFFLTVISVTFYFASGCKQIAR